ncbi:unnamed protein product [Pleuronectes platessa]|uniref:Uncharacterized protein n=1 Tax=Pleuronectes platessa TaxID=8262 RepID=A0A9N7Z812_PLEPL|nr:unnamed protein product [Pleuronectes platessa]
MPFCKRTTLPKDVCKPGGGGLRLREARPRRPPEVFSDLADVCGFSLCSVLRQLSDLSRHSVSILEELEGELVSVCRRSGALEGRLVRLQRRVGELLSKPPPRGPEWAGLQDVPEGSSPSLHLSPLHLTSGDLWLRLFHMTRNQGPPHFLCLVTLSELIGRVPIDFLPRWLKLRESQAAQIRGSGSRHDEGPW